MRISDDDKGRVRTEHRLPDVLERSGVHPPPGWDGRRDYKVCCPMPNHPDTKPSMVVHVDTDRYHCFGCGAHGDVMQLVMSVEGVTSLAEAAQVLDSGRPLVIPPLGRGAAHPAAVEIAAVERPHLDRTPGERILAANDEAWRYYTLPALAGRAAAYLAERGIDTRRLNAGNRRVAAGYTPWSATGLVDHLRRRGFSDDELVDAGWASRHDDGRITDRYRRRVLIPVRDENDLIIGIYGRDTTGRASAKYLNTPDTAVFNKGRALYRPIRHPDPDATIVVCEGSLDALAIASAAASTGRSYAPVSPSGTALTPHQADLILQMSRRPPVICADGDAAGIAAAARWAELLISRGRETFATVLPGGGDPADWLQQRGADGLAAFDVLVPMERVGPEPAGGVITGALLSKLRERRLNPTDERDRIITHLARLGTNFRDRDARIRFAAAAAPVLARADLGPDGWLTRRLISDMTAPIRAPAPSAGRETSPTPAAIPL